jgi:hypothetical protein
MIAALILAGIATAGIISSAVGAKKAKKAAEEAGRKTSAERKIEAEAASVVTGVDRADIETQISQGATPIGGAIAAQQQDIAQQDIAAGGGTGVPGQVSGRTAALQRQLAVEGSMGLAQVATGAQRIGEEKAQVGEERKLALLGESANLARLRKDRVAALRAQQSAAWSGAGQSALGGVSSGIGSSATPSLLPPSRPRPPLTP